MICESLPGLHWEVKRVEAGNPYLWMEQATRDAGDSKIPVVAHKRNGRDWLCIMRAEDLFALLRETNQPLTSHNTQHDKDEQGDCEGTYQPAAGSPPG